MADIGQAYVQILPKATGIKGAIEKQMGPEAASAGSKAGGLFSGKFKSMVVKAALGAAVFKGIAASMKQGAELQQSLGGIETLYKGSADLMKKYASEAYKSVGVSANEYMQNVTSFSAGLIASVGGNTKKAAKTANMAMVDMSDNANKMGTNMQDIQNAYQGFAKQNYTMLDNLKLGYGGTKTEMERLLKDAQKLTGEKYDISNLNDVYKAIHAIQKDLDITGTTAKEAEHTFSGSFNAMKAAASDLLGNLAIGGDVEQPLKNFVDTAKTFLVDNFLPMLESIVDQLPTVLSGLSDAITPMMPTLIDAGVAITTSIIQGLVKSAPLLIDGLFRIIKAAFEALKEVDWKQIGTQIFDQIKESFSANPEAMTAIMAVLGLKMGKSLLGGLSGVLQGSGGISSILGKVFGSGSAATGAAGAGGGGFLSDPAKTAKGLGSVAIILGGVTAIVEAYGALNKIPGIQEFTAGGGELLKKVFDAIGQIATPQTAAIFASTEVLGAIGPGIAASGIASLATLIGGLTVIVEAFGALNKIPGIQQFTEGGGDLLANVMKQIGRAVGAIAEGFAVEISNGLPEIGQNLGAFANNSKPFFDMCSSADFSGMDGFASGLAALVGADIVNKLEKLFGSGLNFGEIGAELSAFAEAMEPFFVTAAVYQGDLPAGLKLMEISGQISDLVSATKSWEAGWGEADLAGLGKALATYAENIGPFFEAATKIGDTSAGVELMSIAGKINKLVSAAKTKEQIGTKGMKDLAVALTGYAEEMADYFKTAADIGDMSAGLELASKSGAINKLTGAARDYKEGSLSSLGLDLLKFSANYKAFSENMSGLGEVDVSGAVSSINKLTSSAKSGGDALAKTVSGMSSGTSSAFSKLKSVFTSGGNSIAKAADFSGKVKTAMTKVNSALTSAKSTIKKNLDSIKKTFSDTKFKLNQSLALPHFSMSGSFDAKTKKVPKVNVSWYAKGFLVDDPTLIGIGAGEAGPEGLIPLNPFWDKLDSFGEKLQGGNTFNVTLNVDGAENPEQYAQRFARELNRQVRMGTV